jgi:hypothetical protein
LGLLQLAATALAALRKRDFAGHAVESLAPCVFAMDAAMPIHLATVAMSLDCLATATRALIGGLVALA